jgi:hypothetical protein
MTAIATRAAAPTPIIFALSRIDRPRDMVGLPAVGGLIFLMMAISPVFDDAMALPNI